nr:AMP-binding protein [Nostocaceae cyanobacterium]
MLSTRPTPETFNLSERERSCMQPLIDYSSVQSLPEIWPIAQEKFGETIALCEPHTKPEIKITYRQLNQQIQQFAIALQILGVQAAERIALFADNSPRWLIADQGIMTAGAVDAVRGGQADKQELLYILQSSGSTALVIEDLKILKKLRPELDSLPIKFVILLSDEQPAASETIKVLNFPQLMAMVINQSLKPVKQDRQTLATLLYTSGTGGQPKSVMLSHGNLMHQVTVLGAVVQPEVGDVVLSILPIWHAFERSGEYFLLSQG